MLAYSRELAKNYQNVDLDILDLVVWWHDVGRLYGDEGHAKKSGEMAKSYFTQANLDILDIDKACESIVDHSNREGGEPKFIEGKILKDADKLDFLTVSRWKIALETKSNWAIEIGINRIPIIRDEILTLPESKMMFDKLLNDLRKYFSGLDNDVLGKYKEKLLAL